VNSGAPRHPAVYPMSAQQDHEPELPDPRETTDPAGPKLPDDLDPDADVQPDMESVQMRQELRRRVRADHVDPPGGQRPPSGGRHSRRDPEPRSPDQRTVPPRPRLNYVPRHAVSTPGPSAVSAEALTEQFQMGRDFDRPPAERGVESSGPQPRRPGPESSGPQRTAPPGTPAGPPPGVRQPPPGGPGGPVAGGTGATVWSRATPPPPPARPGIPRMPTMPPAAGLPAPGPPAPGLPVAGPDGPMASGPIGSGARRAVAEPGANEITGSIDRITDDDPAPPAGPHTAGPDTAVPDTAGPKGAVLTSLAGIRDTGVPGAVTGGAQPPSQTPAAGSRGTSKGGSAVDTSAAIEGGGAVADPPPGKRVRVVLSQRKGTATRPVRTVVEIQELTQVGELLSASLIRSQLALALRIGGVIAIALGPMPAVFLLFPLLGRVEIFGLRLPWLLLGVLAYPFMLALGHLHARRAEHLEQVFADHIQS